MKSKAHWEHIYESKNIREVSWIQEHAAQSIELIKKAHLSLGAKIIDVGRGASTLVDDLLDQGLFRNHRARHLGDGLADLRTDLGSVQLWSRGWKQTLPGQTSNPTSMTYGMIEPYFIFSRMRRTVRNTCMQCGNP